MTRVLVLLTLLLGTSPAFAADGGHVPPPPPGIPPPHVPPPPPPPPTTPVAAQVERWATCSECAALTVERVAKLGNDALESLEKAYLGDPTFLRIPDRQRQFEAGYDRFRSYLSEPVTKPEFVKSETDKVLWLARVRAQAVLLRIGTPEAEAILRRGAADAARSP